jgi:hypothetical protein
MGVQLLHFVVSSLTTFFTKLFDASHQTVGLGKLIFHQHNCLWNDLGCVNQIYEDCLLLFEDVLDALLHIVDGS